MGDEAAASAATIGDEEQPQQLELASTQMRVVHRELQELGRFRGEHFSAAEVDDDNEKSLTNKDALLMETNPLERAEVLANEEAGKRDRMRREDSKKVLQQYIDMQVMAEINRRKRLRAASKTLDDVELLAGGSGDGHGKGDSDSNEAATDDEACEADVATQHAGESGVDPATDVTAGADAGEAGVDPATDVTAGADAGEAIKAPVSVNSAPELESIEAAEASAVPSEYKSETVASHQNDCDTEKSSDSLQALPARSTPAGEHRFDYV